MWRAIGFVYEYNAVGLVRFMCACEVESVVDGVVEVFGLITYRLGRASIFVSGDKLCVHPLCQPARKAHPFIASCMYGKYSNFLPDDQASAPNTWTC
jgi:hypothetical protein